MKQLLILTALLFSFLGVTLAQSSDMGGNTDTPPSVAFSKNPIIVGIGDKRSSQTPDYPATTPPTLSHQVKATIAPKAQAGEVTFESSDTNKSTVSEVSRKDVEDTTEVILLVTGLTGTPAAATGGDTDVKALYKGKTISTAKVKVLKPTKRKNEVPASPAKWNSVDTNASGVPYQYRSTVSYDVKITVYDQFGTILDSIYNGQGVVEELLLTSASENTGWIVMNEPDKEFINGVKIDKVSSSMKDVEYDWLNNELPISAADATLWPTWQKKVQGWNNTVALEAAGIILSYVQALKVDSHIVTPHYKREYEIVKVDFPGIPLKVTDVVQ